jgi:hypothetical protein
METSRHYCWSPRHNWSISYLVASSNSCICPISQLDCPVALFAPLFLFRVALSPYWLIVDEKKSSQDIRSRLKLIEESQPNIVFHSVRDAQLFRDSNISQGKKRPIYRVLQVWFKNSPAISNEQSMAKSVTSIIEFKNKARSSSIVKVYGVWAVENPPDFVGSAKSSSSVDILPGNLPVKLNIAIKFISEASAYAFSLESFTRGSRWKGHLV